MLPWLVARLIVFIRDQSCSSRDMFLFKHFFIPALNACYLPKHLNNIWPFITSAWSVFASMAIDHSIRFNARLLIYPRQ